MEQTNAASLQALINYGTHDELIDRIKTDPMFKEDEFMNRVVFIHTVIAGGNVDRIKELESLGSDFLGAIIQNTSSIVDNIIGFKRLDILEYCWSKPTNVEQRRVLADHLYGAVVCSDNVPMLKVLIDTYKFDEIFTGKENLLWEASRMLYLYSSGLNVVKYLIERFPQWCLHDEVIAHIFNLGNPFYYKRLLPPLFKIAGVPIPKMLGEDRKPIESTPRYLSVGTLRHPSAEALLWTEINDYLRRCRTMIALCQYNRTSSKNSSRVPTEIWRLVRNMLFLR